MSSRPRQSSQTGQTGQAGHTNLPGPQSAIYNAIMTPIIFVSFLFSLAWVEFRFSVLRGHSHDNPSSSSSSTNNGNSHDPDDCCHTWMPLWLHHLIYRRQAYQYIMVHKNETGKGNDTNEANKSKDNQNYYHSMQRKLLKMETAEAFRVRTTVLAVMAGGAAVAVWGAVASVRWLSAWVGISS